MRPTIATIAFASTALLLSAATEAAPGSAAKRLIRGSTDGDRTYYTASCRDGGRASVFVKHKTGETCAVPRNGAPQCAKDGPLSDAAEKACKAPPRG
jgi:hypothetical protein